LVLELEESLQLGFRLECAKVFLRCKLHNDLVWTFDPSLARQMKTIKLREGDWQTSGASCTILLGDSLKRLKDIPESSIHCCVTSPPYWALRDYGTAVWEGGDPNCEHDWGRSNTTPKKSGKLEKEGHFRSYSYVNQGKLTSMKCLKGCGAKRIDNQLGSEETPEQFVSNLVELFRGVHRVLRDDGTLWLNLGDTYVDGRLMGMPWRVALALQDNGWILRQDIIWHKKSPMPETVKRRCTRAHEYLFMLTKSKDYYYDAEAIKERCKTESGNTEMANKRSVWSLPHEGWKDGHFATFPKKMVLPCLRAGTSAEGCCPKCGAPMVRIVERTRKATRPGTDTKSTGDSSKEGNRDPKRHVTVTKTLGWEKSCQCKFKTPVPCVALDPFMGSGTTAEVALSLGRHVVGIELNPEYHKQIKKRVRRGSLNKGLFQI
jgi:DNA modification methylase